MSIVFDFEEILNTDSSLLLSAHADWERVRLGEVAGILNGFAFKSTQFTKDKGMPLIRIRDIASTSTECCYSGSYEPTYVVRAGDLLVGMDGDFRAARWQGAPALLNQRVCRLTPDQRFYLADLLRFALTGYLDAIHRYTSAQTVTHLSSRTIAEIPLPLPPLAEQRRIVEKVETLLAQVNAARARLAKVPAILKRLRQSILSAACSGRLTNTRADEEWTSTDLRSVATIGTGSTPLRSNKAFYTEKGTPWITSAATSLATVTKAEEFVTEAAVRAHRLKRYPIGTLLVAMYGEGKTRGQVTELGIEATVNQACSAIVVDGSKALRGFVKLVLQSNYLSMRELAEGGNQPNLSLGKIRELPISVPPLSEQREIVRRVDAMFKLADVIEARVAEATARADRLTQAILAKAFRGQLVPTEAEVARREGRPYEPASVLLDRIRAERAQATRVPARPRRRRQPAPATR